MVGVNAVMSYTGLILLNEKLKDAHECEQFVTNTILALLSFLCSCNVEDEKGSPHCGLTYPNWTSFKN